MGMSIERVSRRAQPVGECPVFNALDGCLVLGRHRRQDHLAPRRRRSASELGVRRDGGLHRPRARRQHPGRHGDRACFACCCKTMAASSATRLAAPEANWARACASTTGAATARAASGAAPCSWTWRRSGPIGELYRYAVGDGLSGPIVSGLLTQNGLALSPDGRTMYLSDSHPKRQQVWAFDYDIDAGLPSNRRVFVDMTPAPGPAGRRRGRCRRLLLDLRERRGRACCASRRTDSSTATIELPMAKPSMCSFGGADLGTLLVTSISAGQDPADPWAGATIMLRPGVQGVAETPFGG